MSDQKPSTEHQRRLNLPMQEVVKNMIIKWLEIRVIYPIEDGCSIFFIQCVPKKLGSIVIPNERNEFSLM